MIANGSAIAISILGNCAQPGKISATGFVLSSAKDAVLVKPHQYTHEHVTYHKEFCLMEACFSPRLAHWYGLFVQFTSIGESRW